MLPVTVPDVAGPGPGAVPAALPADQLPAPGPAVNPPTPTPVPAPVQAAPVPGPPPVTDPVAVAKQNLLDTQQLNTDIEQNRAERDKLQSDLAAKQAENEARKAQALSTFLTQQQQHRQAADQEIQDKRRQYEGQQFHSLWGTRTTGQKVGIALGVLAGGIGWDSNHTNRGLQMLQEAEQEDFARQKEQHADLWRDLQLSLDGRKELDSRQLHELSDWQSLEAAKWSAVASKLNGMVALNKGRGESLEAKKAAVEATEKANTAWQNAVQAKATAKHMEAQTRLTNEEVKNQPGIRDLHKAETEKAYADAANARALAGQGGMDKLSQTLLQRFPSILQRDQDVKVLYGNDATPGPLRVLPRVAQLQDDIKNGVSSRDNTKVLESVIASKELLSKLLTGGQLNETKAKVLDSIQGSPSESRAKLERILGDPKASEQLVHGIYGLLDDVREQNLKLADDARSRLQKKHLGPNSPYSRNPALKAAVQDQVEALTSEIKNGGGTPRYPEGGASPVQATAAVKFTPPAGAIRGKLANGQAAYKLPNGQVVDENGQPVR